MADIKPHDRSSRVEESRTMETRRRSRRVPYTIHTIPRELWPADMEYFRVRESLLGEPDANNMSKRLQEDWYPVPASRHPELIPPTMPGYEGVETSILRDGGLVLMEKPREFVEEDRRKQQAKQQAIMEGISGYIEGGTSDMPRFVERNQTQIEQVTSYKK